MNDSTEIMASEECSAVCGKLKAFKALSVGADYDITLRLTDDSGAKTSECSHHLKGNSRHSLMNILAFGGLITAAIAATVCFVHVFCSLVCRSH